MYSQLPGQSIPNERIGRLAVCSIVLGIAGLFLLIVRSRLTSVFRFPDTPISYYAVAVFLMGLTALAFGATAIIRTGRDLHLKGRAMATMGVVAGILVVPWAGVIALVSMFAIR
jgi:drug/metabolite transporter (DMT)-like permease